MQNHAVDPFGIVGQVLDGQFRVDRLVGEGGFSAVYRGFHLGLQEPVAVKCLKLPPSLSAPVVDQFAKRFRDESRILYRLSQGNLNVVRSIAAGTWQTNTGIVVPYMILEWLEGRSLANEFTIRRTVGQQGRSLEEVVSLFAPAADGLGYAHSQGVVHRDVNPGNLFLASTQQGTRMKVLDFGVAKILDESTLNIARMHTVGQIRIFAPAYGAPEQFDDSIGQVVAASDVYAFALIVLEAMRDRTVNEGAHLGEFAMKAIDPNRRPTPRLFGIDVPDEVDQVFARATKLDPRERWQNANEFWQALTIAATEASQQKHVVAAKETPSLGMPASMRSTKTGVAPPPDASTKATTKMDKTMPLGAVFPALFSKGGTEPPAARPPESDPLPSFSQDDALTPVVASPLGGGAEASEGRPLAGTLMMAPSAGDSPQRKRQPMATTMPLTGPQPTAGYSGHSGPKSGTLPPPALPPYPQQGAYTQQGQFGQPASFGNPQHPQHPHVPPSGQNPVVGHPGYGNDAGEHVSMAPASVVGPPPKNRNLVLAFVALAALGLLGLGLTAIALTKRQAPTPAASHQPAPLGSASVVSPSASTPPVAVEPAPVAVPTTTPTAKEPDETDEHVDAGGAAPSSTPPRVAPPPDVAPTPPAPVPVPVAVKDAGPPPDPNAFNEAAARSKLGQANGVLGFCMKPGGITGPGAATVVFKPDGSVASVTMEPPYAGTPTGDCVAGQFKRTKANAFQGAPHTLKHTFDVPK